jgi:hypothetical protein
VSRVARRAGVAVWSAVDLRYPERSTFFLSDMGATRSAYPRCPIDGAPRC